MLLEKVRYAVGTFHNALRRYGKRDRAVHLLFIWTTSESEAGSRDCFIVGTFDIVPETGLKVRVIWGQVVSCEASAVQNCSMTYSTTH